MLPMEGSTHGGNEGFGRMEGAEAATVVVEGDTFRRAGE
jgi:hypothetical protein